MTGPTYRQYNNATRIAFDPGKDAANLAKHGVSLAQAEDFEWKSLWAKLDTRRDYGEPRMIGFGYIGARLFCVVFVDRDVERQIVSLRRANSREVRLYAKNA